MDEISGGWDFRFREALVHGDLLEAIAILESRNKHSGTPRGHDKVKALEVVQTLASHWEEKQGLAVMLLETISPAARSLAAMLAVRFIVSLYEQQPEAAEAIILQVAKDSHWEVREEADNVMVQLVKADFDGSYDLLKRWALHPSEKVRRAVVMTAKKGGRERRLAWANPLLDLLEILLDDRSVYVRKNLGPFAIGDGFLRYHSALTLERLSQWAECSDDQVRWNVAMAFSTAEAARHVDAAIPILEHLAIDERRYVWRAVASAMRNLGRRVPGRILPILEKWLDDELRVKPSQIAMKYLP